MMIGLDPATLAAYDLQPDPCPPTEWFGDSVPDKRERIMRSEAGAAWVEEYSGQWDDDLLLRIPVEVLDIAFSVSEILRIWAGQAVMSRISQHITECHPLLEKVRHSVHHFTCEGNGGTYNIIVAAMRGLWHLRWPGGDVRIAYVSKYREDGPAENIEGREQRVWLDNDLGILVHVGGEHVLTVGFGVGADGVFVSQVQLRQKKGNRWLFRLGAHYLDAALRMMLDAFGMPVWLVTGESALAAVKRSYGAGKCGVTDEAAARIVALYDRPLAEFERSTETRAHYGRTYVRLERRHPLRTITRYVCEICGTEYDTSDEALACEDTGLPEPMPFIQTDTALPAFGENGIAFGRVGMVHIERRNGVHVWVAEHFTSVSHNCDGNPPVYAFDPRRGYDAFRYECSEEDAKVWRIALHAYGFSEADADAYVVDNVRRHERDRDSMVSRR